MCIRDRLLIEQCYIELKKFIDTLPEFYKILVTSDSERFLAKASTLPRTYIIPGKVIHIRYKTTDTSAYMKTFLDMFLLSGAESLVLFKTGKMYNLSLIHISEPTRQAEISYAVFCLKKKKKKTKKNTHGSKIESKK